MQQTIYNLTGANVRLNVASDDASTSVVDIALHELFESMRQEILTSGEFGSDLGETLHDRIYQMEAAVGTPAYARKYAAFLSLAADHIETFRPFLPALSQLFLWQPLPALPAEAGSHTPPASD